MKSYVLTDYKGNYLVDMFDHEIGFSLMFTTDIESAKKVKYSPGKDFVNKLFRLTRRRLYLQRIQTVNCK